VPSRHLFELALNELIATNDVGVIAVAADLVVSPQAREDYRFAFFNRVLERHIPTVRGAVRIAFANREPGEIAWQMPVSFKSQVNANDVSPMAVTVMSRGGIVVIHEKPLLTNVTQINR